jgi:hypothetical protein
MAYWIMEGLTPIHLALAATAALLTFLIPV